MDTANLVMERSEARELYEKYQGAIHYGTGIDREIARCYRLLGQGKLIVKALESIGAAGLNEDHLPKLALIRADAKQCWLRLDKNGAASFTMRENDNWRSATRITLPAGTFQPPPMSFPISWRDKDGSVYRAGSRNARAVVPIVPLHLRPKHALTNYHILWEADWQAVPRDPFLLRRLGKGDLWLVVAMWDLTEVERAALQARV